MRMKKRDLVHLHALLAQVATFCEQEEDLALDLTAYKSLQTSPTSLRRNMDDHKQAVRTLADELVVSMREESDALPADARGTDEDTRSLSSSER